MITGVAVGDGVKVGVMDGSAGVLWGDCVAGSTVGLGEGVAVGVGDGVGEGVGLGGLDAPCEVV